MAIWEAPNSSPQERRDAAMALIRVGTDLKEVEQRLGQPTRRERLHGPTLYSNPEQANHLTVGPPMDIWRLVYEFGGGDLVYLDFEISPAEGQKWPFLGASASNSNRISSVEFPKPAKQASPDQFE